MLWQRYLLGHKLQRGLPTNYPCRSDLPSLLPQCDLWPPDVQRRHLQWRYLRSDANVFSDNVHRHV